MTVMINHTPDTPTHPNLRAALLAFMAGLPFSFGSIQVILYYWAFMLVFTVVGMWRLQYSPGLIQSLLRAHPWLGWVLVGWVVSMSISLANVFIFADPGGRQTFAAIARYLYDIVLLGFVGVVARLIWVRALSLTATFMALAVGLLLMVFFHIYVYQSHQITSDMWFSTPPLGPHIRDQGNLACAVIAALSAIALVRSRLAGWQMAALGILLMVAWSFLFWTGGRMGLAASALTVVILTGWRLWSVRSGIMNTVLRASIVLAVIPMGFALGEQFSVYEWNGVGRTIALTEQVSTDAVDAAPVASLNKITTGRAAMWQMSINAMLEKPLFGLGPFGYFFIPERTYDDQPHNFVVQFLVEWGFIGTALMLILMAACGWQALRVLSSRIRAGDESYVIGCAVVLVLTIHGLTGGTYFKIQPITCVALGYAALVAWALRKPDKVFVEDPADDR